MGALPGAEFVRKRASMSLVASTPFIRVLEEAGENVLEHRNRALVSLLPRYELSEQALAVEGARIPHELALEVLERSAHLLHSEALSLRAARAWKMGDHGIGDYLNATCSTLGEMIGTMTNHVGLLHDGVRLSTHEEGELTLLKCEFDEDTVPHRSFSEFVLAKVVVEVHRALGHGGRGGPAAVHLSHSAPSYEREYAGALGLPVEFDQGHDAIVFSTKSLATRLTTADPVLNHILRRQVATMMSGARPRRSFLEEVRALAAEELPRNSADQGCVARRLGMSAATLRRRLEQERGAPRYSELVDCLRRAVATEQLSMRGVPIDEIGWRVGFSQKTAFYRAFRRWYGCTPVEFRRSRGAG